MLAASAVLLLCLPATLAGDWIVETHSLVIRAPPSIAGTEDAAMGDVSQQLMHVLFDMTRVLRQMSAQLLTSLTPCRAVWCSPVWCKHAG